MSDLKEKFVKEKLKILDQFLDEGKVLTIDTTPPIVSIILVLYNRAELTLACIQSIVDNVRVPHEIVIVDNDSKDRTDELLSLVKGNVKVIENKDNSGFLLACNMAAREAKGSYLLFLNNDAEIHELSLASSLSIISSSSDIGAVGGKIIMLNGNLQEAGCIVWNDGSCIGYGREEDPDKPEFNFRREVDFCSGAYLLTSKSLFEEIGGFDERLVPAYYEEVDYCIELKKRGYKVIYDPKSVITHFEFASSESSQKAIDLQIKNKTIFYNKHKEVLESHYPYSPTNVLFARNAGKKRKRILYLEDRVPHQDLGSGYPRSNHIANILIELNFEVALYSVNFKREDSWEDVYRDMDPRVEVVVDYNRPGFVEFSHLRPSYYDLVWISRPPNMDYLKDKLFGFLEGTKFIYDAEAVFSERSMHFNELLNPDDKGHEDELKEELDLHKYVHQVITVKKEDNDLFLKAGAKRSDILSVIAEGEITEKTFEERSGLLFVGNMDYDESPNVDSIVWFCENVFPKFKKIHKDAELHLVGSSKSQLIQALGSKDKKILVHGRVDDLKEVFGKARIFIAPTRFSAGIPLKVFTSAAYGLPVIGSELIVRQSGLKDKESIVGASILDPELFLNKLDNLYSESDKWKKIRESALRYIEDNHSREAFKSKITEITKQVLEFEEGPQIKPSEFTTTLSSSGVSHENLPVLEQVKLAKQYITELKAKNLKLTSNISEGHLYVVKLLDEIKKKEAEIEKRGGIIKEYESDFGFRVARKLSSPWLYIKRKKSLFGPILSTILKNPFSTVKNLSPKNIKTFLTAIREEPMNKIEENLEKKLRSKS